MINSQAGPGGVRANGKQERPSWTTIPIGRKISSRPLGKSKYAKDDVAMDEPTINPYQSPTLDQGNRGDPGDANRPSRPAYTLYSPGSVALAAILGSFLAGGIVMAINYKRSGQGVSAIDAYPLVVLATMAIITVAMMIPDEAHIPIAAFVVPSNHQHASPGQVTARACGRGPTEFGRISGIPLGRRGDRHSHRFNCGGHLVRDLDDVRGTNY